MKKVKIMLSGILVLAVVGGAMAFNAAKKTNFCLFTYQASPVETCNFLTSAVITEPGFGATTLGVIKEKSTGQSCSQVAPANASECNQVIRTIAE